jgi:NitT/TauT family transport system substrate-binding protein
MGLVKLLADADTEETFGEYEFTMAASPDEITPKLVSGELDIATVPANLAAVLFNNTDGEIQALAINTLGVLYIVDTTGEIADVADLKGRTIYANGLGATPEFALRYILEANGLDPDKDVTLDWRSEHSEVVAALAANGGVAMLPQPFVTVAQTAIEGLEITLDLTAEWEAVADGSELITGVTVVRKAFADKYPLAVARFLADYETSAEWVNANVSEASVMIEQFDIVKASVAELALPYCNIVCVYGEEMKPKLDGYLEVLFSQNPKAVGGVLPGDGFYR